MTSAADLRGDAVSDPAPVRPDDPRPRAAGLEGAVLVRTPVRRVDVTGADRTRYLDDVTTQSLAEISAGSVHGSLYLDQHGAPLAMFDVAVLADRLALLTPDAGVADTVVEVLGGRTFLLDARFALTDDVVVALRGPDAAKVADAANLATRPGTVRPAGDTLFLIGRGGGSLDIVGPPDAVGEVGAVLLDVGAREGNAADLEAWRIVDGIPAWGVEVTSPHLPEELGLLASHVHLSKGCYPGQEAVARMWMLGRPRRRLAVITAPAGTLAQGWQAGSGRRRVTVTTALADGSRALAFVPGDAEVGQRFGADANVEVAAIVGGDDWPPGHDPSVARRRDRRAS